GRTGLREAMERFHELTVALIEQDPVGAGGRPTLADEEALSRHVINWVGNHLGRDPRRDAVVARLLAEQRSLDGDRGGARHPPAGAVPKSVPTPSGAP